MLQVSSWGSRPLTAAQLEYAALDAHAAVMVRQDPLSFPSLCSATGPPDPRPIEQAEACPQSNECS